MVASLPFPGMEVAGYLTYRVFGKVDHFKISFLKVFLSENEFLNDSIQLNYPFLLSFFPLFFILSFPSEISETDIPFELETDRQISTTATRPTTTFQSEGSSLSHGLERTLTLFNFLNFVLVSNSLSCQKTVSSAAKTIHCF